MPRKLYSFIVGIADYVEASKLPGCLVDVNNMIDYIGAVKNSNTSFYDEIFDPIVLTDKEGQRENIIFNLENLVSKLEGEDTLMFYFCGHGVNEVSNGQFYGNFNDNIQSLYCYDSDENNRLTSKEIRYILNQSPKESHILSIIDCCHSGEMTRSVRPKIRRRSASASAKPERSFNDFIFKDKTTDEAVRSKEFNEIFPDSNVVTLSACLSREEAFGNDYGGFFTTSLLRILYANNDVINYADLLKQIDLDIRREDKWKQAPAISILGDRRYDQSTSWLRMNGDNLKSGYSFIKYNYEIGSWIFSKGVMHGVEVGNTIRIKISDEETADLIVDSVNLVDSVIHSNSTSDLELKDDQIYKVTYSDINKRKPNIGLNNLDCDQALYQQVESILKVDDSINYVDDLNNADYHVNLFNDFLYFSYPNLSYQPLNRQFDLSKDLGDLNSLKSFLRNDMIILTNWFHLKKLEIQDTFPEIPLSVELRYDKGEYIDITNGIIDLNPEGRSKKKSVLYKKHDLRITNTSSKTIHVTLLALYNSRHSISTHAFKNETVDIDPGKSKEILDYWITLDNYQEIYNWEYEKVTLKFLVNTYGKIDQDIASWTQEGFLEPLTLQDFSIGTSRGGGGEDELENPIKNGLYTSEVVLNNNTLNKITGELEERLASYLEHKKLGPFIRKLYPEMELNKDSNKNV